MSYFEQSPQSPAYEVDSLAQRRFIAKTYGWMTAGLMITAIVAMVVAMAVERGALAGINPKSLIVLMFVQLGIAMGMRWLLDKIPGVIVALMFLAYAVITGLFFSIYFLVFTSASIASTFFVCAGTFGAMSLYGYFTQRDLTSLGSLCMMALLGLLLATLVNIFLASDALYWITTYVGIAIFVGLTAYDTQKMKYMYLAGEEGSDAQFKAALLAAFELYLDFIILFQYLLRLLGRRR